MNTNNYSKYGKDNSKQFCESKNSRKTHYVVIIGRKPGIYRSWPECNDQVRYFHNAVFQGFVTESEAVEYYATGVKKCEQVVKLRSDGYYISDFHQSCYIRSSDNIDDLDLLLNYFKLKQEKDKERFQNQEAKAASPTESKVVPAKTDAPEVEQSSKYEALQAQIDQLTVQMAALLTKNTK